MAATKTPRPGRDRKAPRPIAHPTANVERFEEMQQHAQRCMVRCRAVLSSARLTLASRGEEDEDLAALLDVAIDSVAEGIEALPALAVLTDEEAVHGQRVGHR